MGVVQDTGTLPSGWTCAACGTFVPYGTPHNCPAWNPAASRSTPMPDTGTLPMSTGIIRDEELHRKLDRVIELLEKIVHNQQGGIL